MGCRKSAKTCCTSSVSITNTLQRVLCTVATAPDKLAQKQRLQDALAGQLILAPLTKYGDGQSILPTSTLFTQGRQPALSPVVLRLWRPRITSWRRI